MKTLSKWNVLSKTISDQWEFILRWVVPNTTLVKIYLQVEIVEIESEEVEPFMTDNKASNMFKDKFTLTPICDIKKLR